MSRGAAALQQPDLAPVDVGQACEVAVLDAHEVRVPRGEFGVRFQRPVEGLSRGLAGVRDRRLLARESVER